MTEPAFQALRSGNFRLGTLSYYRKIEDPARRDYGEGPSPVYIKGHDTGSRTVEADEFNRAAGSAGAPIRLNSTFKVQINGPGKLLFETALSLFVFCVTQEDIPNPALDAKFGSRRIEIPDPHAFARAVAQRLVAELIGEKRIKLNAAANSISHGHHPVVYQRKEATPVEDVTDSRTDLAQVFVKDPDSFEEESEYRFIWFPEDNVTKRMCFIPPDLDYLDISMPSIWDHIREASK